MSLVQSMTVSVLPLVDKIGLNVSTAFNTALKWHCYVFDKV